MPPERDHHHQEHVQPGQDLHDSPQGREEHGECFCEASDALPAPIRRHGELNIQFLKVNVKIKFLVFFTNIRL